MRGHTALLAHSTGVRDDYVSANIKVAVRQFNEIHDFPSSSIFSTMVFCTGVIQYACCFVY